MSKSFQCCVYTLVFYVCALWVCNFTITIVCKLDTTRVRPSNQQPSIKNWLTILQPYPMPLFLIDAWGFLLIGGDRKSSLYLTSITLLGTNMSHFSRCFRFNDVPFRLFGWYWYVSYFPCKVTKVVVFFPTKKTVDSTPGFPSPPEDSSSLVHARGYLPPPEIDPKVLRPSKSPFWFLATQKYQSVKTWFI